jgi:hypothetical protein
MNAAAKIISASLSFFILLIRTKITEKMQAGQILPISIRL